MQEVREARIFSERRSLLGSGVMTDQTHEPFITVSSGMSGYFAVMMAWDGDGYEPWDTGIGRYPEKSGAVREAMQWALDEELEYKA